MPQARNHVKPHYGYNPHEKFQPIFQPLIQVQNAREIDTKTVKLKGGEEIEHPGIQKGGKYKNIPKLKIRIHKSDG